jgi:sulfite reductase (NADPH) hemoprotein beta-component
MGGAGVSDLGRSRLGFGSREEIDEFVQTLERYEKGELGPDAWRAFRLVRGTYGQRQAGDVQMLRVKIPQGVLGAEQLEALADVAVHHSRGFGHVTTRQNVQFHFLKLHEVEHAMRRLEEAGLTTREACGNAVRNVTACPYAGVSESEAFDVTPYAEAMTRYLLRHPLSSSLPRKFKIAFEGCQQDHVLASINDLGFLARIREGERGFRVVVGGGTAILPTPARELFDFLPAKDILNVAEAILRVFHSLGDYAHKQRNRLKFLIRTLGYDAFRDRFSERLREVLAEGGEPLPFDRAPALEEGPPEAAHVRPPIPEEVAEAVRAESTKGPGLVPDPSPQDGSEGAFRAWRATNVRRQKQRGFAVVTVRLVLGDLTAAQMRVVGRLALAYGDGTVRTTSDQNLILRWVREETLAPLFARLAAAGLGRGGAGTIGDVTSCPGAEACRLAVTQSRGLGRLLGERLSRPEVVAAAPGLSVKISGCPNGCGQHHVAGIGLQGSVRRLGDRVVPQYFVMLGGGVDSGGARFGRLAAKVPARRVGDAIERLVALYTAEGEAGEPPTAFFRRVEIQEVKDLLADLEAIHAEDALPSDYVDLGDEKDFVVETQAGECSA